MHTETTDWPAKKEPLQLLSDLFRPPDKHFKVSGKMQQRLGIRQFNARDLRHGVDVKLSFGILQLPRQMMDVSAKNAALIDGIKAVALGEKSFNGIFVVNSRRRGWPIARVEVCRSRLLQTAAGVPK